MKKRRAIIVVLDSVGVGALPDAAAYGDEGSNTLANTAAAVGGLHLPSLRRLGLGNIIAVQGVSPVAEPLAAHGRLAEVSAGKDTTTGHWELMGLRITRPFPTYPDGFPDDVVRAFEDAIGRKVLGNKPASGTEIIEELGEEHLRTGRPILYTSADSVFQVAAHEAVITVDGLYGMCEKARRMLVGEHAVGRVIARPFVGIPGHFTRTPRRKDFSLLPPSPTMLDWAREAGIDVYALGKINEIFTGRGISEFVKTADNMDGMNRLCVYVQQRPRGIIFANLIDFDMLWGHRNDAPGYAAGLEAVDRRLPELLDLLGSDDFLVLTADHGCDPTTPSTDHSREYVPLLVFGEGISPVDLDTRRSFSDVGKTVAELMGFAASIEGESFAAELTEGRGLDPGPNEDVGV